MIFGKIKNFLKNIIEDPVYTLTKDEHDNILINENFYLHFFPKIYEDSMEINSHKKITAQYILDTIIENNLIIPTFDEIIKNPNNNYKFYKISGFFGLKLIFLIILFFLSIYTFKYDYMFSLILIYILITNFVLFNYFNIYCQKYLYVFYVNNIIPFLYMWYLIYLFKSSNYFNYNLNYIIFLYFILIILFVIILKKIPTRYENIYIELKKIKLVEKNDGFYLCKDSVNFFINLL